MSLQLLEPGKPPTDKTGEVLTCSYTPDGAFVLSGGWDGQLRLWEAAFGGHVSSFRASDKPVSACAVSADGKRMVSGSLDGLLAVWDSLTHQQQSMFLAHTRPISAIVLHADGRSLATASWDGTVGCWKSPTERDGRLLSGHTDIVAGCRFTPDCQHLLSWSHDKTVRLWDMASGRQRTNFTGHQDRVNAGAVAPDGRWAASGSRDGSLKLWDLLGGREVASAQVGDEVRGCVFLLDGETLVAADAHGRLTLHRLPDLKETAQLRTELPVTCAEVSPTGSRLVLGCGDGQVRFVAVEGFDGRPLLVTATQTTQRSATPLQRLFGRSRVVRAYQCLCPVCRHSFDLPSGNVGQLVPCPNCRRGLRVGALAASTSDA